MFVYYMRGKGGGEMRKQEARNCRPKKSAALSWTMGEYMNFKYQLKLCVPMLPFFELNRLVVISCSEGACLSSIS